MKKFYLFPFILLLVFLYSCNRTDKSSTMISSYIRSYEKIVGFDRVNQLTPNEDELSFSNCVVSFFFVPRENIENLACVHSLREKKEYDYDISCKRDTPEVFDSLRNHIGDINCPEQYCPDLSQYTTCSQPSAIVDKIVSVVITSDKDWDETHPAGSSLNDIVKVRFASHYPFISSGYEPQYCIYDGMYEPTNTQIVDVSELEYNDLYLLDPNVSLKFYFNVPEHIHSCTLSFKFFTEEQQEFVGSILINN